MATFKKTNKKKLSNLVKRQLPEFVLEDHPKFAEFIKSYYLFLESAEIQLSSFTSVENILLLSCYRDADGYNLRLLAVYRLCCYFFI